MAGDCGSVAERLKYLPFLKMLETLANVYKEVFPIDATYRLSKIVEAVILPGHLLQLSINKILPPSVIC